MDTPPTLAQISTRARLVLAQGPWPVPASLPYSGLVTASLAWLNLLDQGVSRAASTPPAVVVRLHQTTMLPHQLQQLHGADGWVAVILNPNRCSSVEGRNCPFCDGYTPPAGLPASGFVWPEALPLVHIWVAVNASPRPRAPHQRRAGIPLAGVSVGLGFILEGVTLAMVVVSHPSATVRGFLAPLSAARVFLQVEPDSLELLLGFPGSLSALSAHTAQLTVHCRSHLASGRLVPVPRVQDAETAAAGPVEPAS